MKPNLLRAYGASHLGQREYNEDAYLIDLELGLAAVADGMGGYSSGDVASRLVLDTLGEELSLGETLVHAFEQAQAAIKTAVGEGIGGDSMGTTLVAARFDGADYQLAWVGDSRAYHWSGNCLSQLSRDHSYLEKLVAEGVLSAGEASRRPDRNLLTQALWAKGKEALQVATSAGALYRGERLLLCSDGLSDVLSGVEIAALLQAHDDPERCASALIDAALAAGGRDNITVLILANDEDEAPGQRPRPELVAVYLPSGQCEHFGAGHIPEPPPKSRFDLGSWLFLGALGALGLLVGGWVYYYSGIML